MIIFLVSSLSTANAAFSQLIDKFAHFLYFTFFQVKITELTHLDTVYKIRVSGGVKEWRHNNFLPSPPDQPTNDLKEHSTTEMTHLFTFENKKKEREN